MLPAIIFACKGNDNSEIERAGQSTDEANTEEAYKVDGPDSDTISAGKEGMNGSGIGSGEPNTSGEDDAHKY